MPKFHSLAEFVRKRWPHAERDTGRTVENWPPPRPPAKVRSPVGSTASWALDPIANSHHVRLKALFGSESDRARREELQPAYKAYEACVDQLYKGLRAGDIIASARPGQPAADAKQLPPTAWNSIRVIDWKLNIARYHRERMRYYDVRLGEALVPLTDGPTQRSLILKRLLEIVETGVYRTTRGGQIEVVRRIAEELDFNLESVRQVVNEQWDDLTAPRKRK